MFVLALVHAATIVAQEAVKQVPSNQTVTWAAVAMAVVANMGTWLMILKRSRAKKSTVNVNSIPPKSFVVPPAESPFGILLKEHESQIHYAVGKVNAHEIEIEHVCKKIDEVKKDNKDDHTAIFNKIDELVRIILKGKSKPGEE